MSVLTEADLKEFDEEHKEYIKMKFSTSPRANAGEKKSSPKKAKIFREFTYINEVSFKEDDVIQDNPTDAESQYQEKNEEYKAKKK